MKHLSERCLGDLVNSMKKWNPPNSARFYFPEDVRRELEGTLAMGRWWEWLPSWAAPFTSFSEEVAVVAAACGVSRVELARRLLAGSTPLHESPVYCWVSEPYSQPVVLWEVVQAVESWIFYDLRPALRAVIELELDCRGG